jgi:hypothetical protein
MSSVDAAGQIDREILEMEAEAARLNAMIVQMDGRGNHFTAEEEREAKQEEEGDERARGGSKWRECLLQILVAATHTGENANRTLVALVQADIESHQRAPKLTDLAMAMGVDAKRKFAVWVLQLLFQGSELKTRISDIGFAAYKCFLSLLDARGQAAFLFLPVTNPDPLSDALTVLRSQTSVAMDFAGAMVVKAAKKKAVSSDDEEEVPKPAVVKKVKKATALVAEEQETDQPEEQRSASIRGSTEEAMVAAIQQISQSVAEFSKMSRGLPAQLAQNTQRGGGGRDPRGDGSGGRRRDRNRGGDRDNRGDERKQDRPASSSSQSLTITAAPAMISTPSVPPAAAVQATNMCRFNPCERPGCPQDHVNGQFLPNENAMRRKGDFRGLSRCILFHDTGACQAFRSPCQRTHGQLSARGKVSKLVCKHVGSGMCPEFYKIGGMGCDFAHRRQ